MEEESSTIATYVFRGIEYVVSMCVGSATLTVEVEDRVTADQWRGSFDAAYVEDLTHKTGNFKQFAIFTNMLESAIKQNSDSVSLDLLTYSDLESLRNRKAGAGRPSIPGANSTNSGLLGSKRYLILTYTVEFDRIHYPLPLPYMGKPDPRKLQETIRQLRQEIKHLKSQGNKDYRIREIEKLNQENKRMKQLKDEIEAELIEYKRQMSLTSKGSAAKELRILKTMIKNLEEDLMKEKTKYQKASHKKNTENRRLLDEIDELKASERNLKARLKSLTNELALYQRDARKMLDHSSSSRRSTGVSGGVNGTGSRQNSFSRRSSRDSFSRDRSSSRENSFSSRVSHTSRDRSRFTRDRSYTSRDRSLSKDRDKSWDRLSGRGSRSNSLDRGGRPNSQDRSVRRGVSSHYDRFNNSGNKGVRSNSQERYASRDRSNSTDRGSRSNSIERGGRSSSRDRGRPSSAGSGRGVYKMAPISAAGARYPRFNPTAYIEEKERKFKEAQRKQKRAVRSSLSGSAERRRTPSPGPPLFNGYTNGKVSRSSSVRFVENVGSFRSRTSSIESLESLSEIGRDSDSGVESRFRKKQAKVAPSSKRYNIPSSPEISFSRPVSDTINNSNKILASTPETDRRLPPKKKAWAGEEPPRMNGLDDGYYERSQEMNEIDERLNRLQNLMKSSLP